MDFLVPVMGYVCRICHKFYHSNSGAQLSHCKSLAHFENLQVSPASRPAPPCPGGQTLSELMGRASGHLPSRLGLSPWAQPPTRGSTHKGNPNQVGAKVFLQLFWSGWC